jgi:hypothetical protein
MSHEQSGRGNFFGEPTDTLPRLSPEGGHTPEPFTVTLGLAEPGGAVSIWVRVVLESGNEKTSQRVVVQRPD